MALFATAPNHRDFFDLFQQAGANTQEATAMIDRLMRDWPEDSGLRGEIKHLEEEGDRITHDILHQLYSTTMTPLDREDIHAPGGGSRRRGRLHGGDGSDVLGLYKIEAPMEQARRADRRAA